jgi:DNA-directed RNA polymerase specialized sigma24 family protein
VSDGVAVGARLGFDARMEESWLAQFPSSPDGQHFPRTRWTLVRRAVHGTPEEKAAAIAELCTVYYKPVYRFLKRALGLPDSEVAAVTQDFFFTLLEKKLLARLDDQTSFRAYVQAVCRFKRKQWLDDLGRRRRAVSQSGRGEDGDGAAIDPAAEEDEVRRSIDREFKRWYIDAGLERTRVILERKGKRLHYELLLATLAYDGDRPPPRAELARRHRLSEHDVKNYVYEARRLLKGEIARLAEEASDDPAGELRDLGIDLDAKRKQGSQDH